VNSVKKKFVEKDIKKKVEEVFFKHEMFEWGWIESSYHIVRGLPLKGGLLLVFLLTFLIWTGLTLIWILGGLALIAFALLLSRLPKIRKCTKEF